MISLIIPYKKTNNWHNFFFFSLMRILIIVCVFSLFGKAQSIQGFKKVNIDYFYYLKNSFEPFFNQKIKEDYKSFIYGRINHDSDLIKITKQNSFSISNCNQDNKILAAILYGTKHYSTYEFVADDYEQYHNSKDIVIKELLRIKIFVIPDTSTMKITKQLKVNGLETITQFTHDKLIHLQNPIIISYYSNHHENKNGIQKNSKTIIRNSDKIIYSSIKIGHKNIVKTNYIINQHVFIYELKNKNKLLTGGLMNEILNNFLSQTKDEIHLKSTSIRKVSDIYGKKSLDLKRIYNKGRLILKGDFKEFCI